jgi:putative transposase
MDSLRVGKAERERLRGIGHSSDVDGAERDRVQMVLLAAEGWSAPRIAQHLGVSDKTVRRALKGWRERGEAALFKRLQGPAPDAARRNRVEAALAGLLTQRRTWSAGQLPARAGGPRHSPGRAPGASLPRRTRRQLAAHEDEPRAQAAQRGRRTRSREAAAAQKRARAGRIDLLYLDECGFSPTQPTGYSWALRGTRKLVNFENTQRRRVNALVAYRPLGRAPGLRFRVRPRTLKAQDVVHLLRRLPSGERPCVVVLDNVGIHVANRVREAARVLRHRGLTPHPLLLARAQLQHPRRPPRGGAARASPPPPAPTLPWTTSVSGRLELRAACPLVDGALRDAPVRQAAAGLPSWPCRSLKGNNWGRTGSSPRSALAGWVRSSALATRGWSGTSP